MRHIERRLAALEAEQARGVYEASKEELEALLLRHLGHAPTNAELQQLAGEETHG